MLVESATPLAQVYDLVALDLDGVVYIGAEAVPYAAVALAEVRAVGSRVAFVTNNAARTPRRVADHLVSLGIASVEADVVISSQAAATMLRQRLPVGAHVYVMGGDGLEVALEEAGLVPVFDSERGVDAVAQGYGPEMPWKRVVEGAILVESGYPWVATNMDSTIPTSVGVGPGNGALVDLVARFSGRDPEVAGKPAPPLLREVQSRTKTKRPLFVGDRLDTDIAGAHNVGWPSLLVRTGVTTLRELVAATPGERPQFLAHDLRGLLEAHPVPSRDRDSWVLGGWRARVHDDGQLRLDGTGSDDDWWRCAATAAWSYADEHQSYPQTGPVRVDEIRPPR